MQHFICIILLLCLFMPHASHGGKIYKWVDAQGKVHFSDTKELQIKQELVKLNVKPSNWEKIDIRINDVDKLLSPEEKERIINDVNAVYQFYDDELHFLIYKTVPVSIRLYQHKTDYLTYLSGITQSPLHNSRGVYLRKNNEIVVWLNPTRELTFWTIKHETSHAIIDTLVPYAPSWLNEGLAENMESILVEDGQLVLAPHPENFLLLKRSIKNNQLLPVKQLLSLTSIEWRKQSLYPQSAELVRMLLSKQIGRNFLSRIIHKFERGDRTLSHILTNKHYIGGLEVLAIDWKNWIKQTAPNKIIIE